MGCVGIVPKLWSSRRVASTCSQITQTQEASLTSKFLGKYSGGKHVVEHVLQTNRLQCPQCKARQWLPSCFLHCMHQSLVGAHFGGFERADRILCKSWSSTTISMASTSFDSLSCQKEAQRLGYEKDETMESQYEKYELMYHRRSQRNVNIPKRTFFQHRLMSAPQQTS